MDGLRLALIIVGIAVVAAVYFWSARRRRYERDAGTFDRFDAWTDDTADPLAHPVDQLQDDSLGDPLPDPISDPLADDRGDEPAGGDGSMVDPDAVTRRNVVRPPPAARGAAPRSAGREPAAPSRPATPPPARPPQQGTLEGLDRVAGPSPHRDEPRLGDLDHLQRAGATPPRQPAAGPASKQRPGMQPTAPPATPSKRAPGGAQPAKSGAVNQPPRTAPPREPGAASRGPAEDDPDRVVVLNVMAPAGQQFAGPALRAALEAAGLAPGDMQLYHYRAQAQPAEAPPIFSALNAVKPGTLAVEQFADMHTPGIALVLRLPGLERPAEAFELMHSAAQSIAGSLQGRVCDGSRSTLTRQAVNHIRESIAEHVRRRRLGG